MLVVAGCARGSFRVSHSNCCEWVFFLLSPRVFFCWIHCWHCCSCCWVPTGLAGATADVHCFDIHNTKWTRWVFFFWSLFFPQKTNKFQWEESKKEEVAPTQVHHSCWSTQNLPPPNCLLRQISFMVAELQFCGDLGFTPEAQSCVWVLRTNWCWNLWFNLKAVCAWI